MFLHGRSLLTYEYSTFIIPQIKSMYTSYFLVIILLFRKGTRLWYTLFNIAVDMHGNFCDIKRSEEHTSELQSRFDLVCRLLLEKKKSNRPSKMRNYSLKTRR